MHIAHLIPGVTPPPDYGGVERLGYWLVREQLRRGHRITVITDPRSTIGDLLPGIDVVRLPPLEHFDRISAPGEWDYRDLIPADADVLHSQAALPLDALPETPFVVTEHGIRRPSRRSDGFQGYSPNTVFVSKSHARNHGAELFVYNGVPLDDYPLSTEKDDSMLFMAALAWRRKGGKTAVHLSFDSGMPLKLAGGQLAGNRAMRGSWKLRARAHPSLLTEYGVVGGQEQKDLLSTSRLLYYIVGWEEPFGIAPHEALACGTPVLASHTGALPEYIRDGANGYLVSSYRDALRRVREVRDASSEAVAEMAQRCRESAFRIEDCADGYMELYERVVKDRWLYPPEQAREIRPRGLDVHKMRRGRRRIRRYPFKLG